MNDRITARIAEIARRAELDASDRRDIPDLLKVIEKLIEQRDELEVSLGWQNRELTQRYDNVIADLLGKEGK